MRKATPNKSLQATRDGGSQFRFAVHAFGPACLSLDVRSHYAPLDMKKSILLVAVMIGCLATGVFAGRWWAWRTNSQLLATQQFDAAQLAAMLAQPLCALRLGETNSAIQTLEMFMDGQVSLLAYRRESDPLDAKSNERIDRCLTPAKIYHESYSVTGEDAAKISAFLAGVPGRRSPNSCSNAVCRLDDVRLAKLSAITNTP